MFAYVRKITYLSVAKTPNKYQSYGIDLRHESHGLMTRKSWTYDSKLMGFDFNLFYFALFLLFY